MRDIVMYVAFAILGTALVLLLLFGDGGTIAGLRSEQFARLGYLTALAFVIGAALVGGRGRLSPRLWHVAAWLGLLVLLMLGYRVFNG